MLKPRVSRACDLCKRRRIRCTGRLPCAHCVKYGKTCEFKAPYTRGAVPEIQATPAEEQERYLQEAKSNRRHDRGGSVILERSKRINQQVLHRNAGEESNGVIRYRGVINMDSTSLTTSDLTPRSLTVSPRALFSQEQEESGLSQGSTDGKKFASASVYERTQNSLNRRREQHQMNPLFAYGDPPLPDVDTSFLIFPSQNTALALVRRYFDTVAATNRILHQPTVEQWTCELLSGIQSMQAGVKQNSPRAVVLMVLASTYPYTGDVLDQGYDNGDIGFLYFQAAADQLDKETGEIHLAALQARLLQCMFLLSRARVNHCYSIFGSIVNFVYTLGIHRQKSSKDRDFLELELQKRVFWSVYVIDKYLSSALGRPQMIRDEDIDQALPLLVKDEHLSADSIQIIRDNTHVPVKGVIFQTKLSQIMSKTLDVLYQIRKLSLEVRLIAVDNLRKSLCNWREDVSHFLDIDHTPLPPIYRRQNVALRLSYSYALILLHRPFLLEDFDDHPDIATPTLQAQLENQVNECLDAALDVVRTINAMYQVDNSFNASWFTHYCGYTAIVAIFVHVIRQCIPPNSPQVFHPNSADDEISDSVPWMKHFNAATECQRQICNSSTVAKEGFAKTCSVVLEELRAEAVNKVQKDRDSLNVAGASNEESAPISGLRLYGASENSRSGDTPTFTADIGLLGDNSNHICSPQMDSESSASFSVLNGLDGIRVRDRVDFQGSLVDRIDRWGFSSLNGY